MTDEEVQAQGGASAQSCTIAGELNIPEGVHVMYKLALHCDWATKSEKAATVMLDEKTAEEAAAIREELGIKP